MDKQLIKEIHLLNSKLHENSEKFRHSRPLIKSESRILLPEKKKHSFTTLYDLKDLLFIGAITESPVLMTGATDLGKTAIAKLVMNSLFGKEGEGWHKLNFDNDFSKDSYTDVKSEFFHESGKSLDDLYAGHEWLKFPGFIADELNRAHAKIATKALHIIKEKEVTLPHGKKVKTGFRLANGNTYQYQIAAINEGSEYTGIFEMDQALRRRTTIEIPINVFTPTSYDRLLIQRDGEVEFPNNENNLETVLKVLNKIKDVKVHPDAEMYLAYLEAFDFCKNSLTGEKGSIETKSGSYIHICSKPMKLAGKELDDAGMSCEYMRSFKRKDLCPYVKGITPGISKNILTVAKGLALVRATKFVELVHGSMAGESKRRLSYAVDDEGRFKESLQQYAGKTLGGKELAKAAIDKYINELEVELEDIESLVGFVGYSKIQISKAYVNKEFQDNKYEAVTDFAAQAKDKFEKGLEKIAGNLKEIFNGEGEHLDKLLDNPWMIRVIQPYVQTRKIREKEMKNIDEMYD